MVINASEARSIQSSEFSFARFADRWIWVFMAALLLVIVLAGFIPSSIQRIQAIQAQRSPPFPWFLHIHAVAMGSWMLLLLAQTLLIGTGRKRWHMSLGAVSVVAAPLVFVMMVVLASGRWAEVLAGRVPSRLDPALAEAPLAAMSSGLAFVLAVQGRAVVLFSIFFVWAYRARHARPDTHKRMMLLATWAMIDAGIARIPGSYELGAALGFKTIGLTARDDIPHFWMLAALAPALVYDLVRRGRIHYSFVSGIGMFLLFAVAAHVLELAPPWWQHIVSGISGRM